MSVTLRRELAPPPDRILPDGATEAAAAAIKARGEYRHVGGQTGA